MGKPGKKSNAEKVLAKGLLNNSAGKKTKEMF